MTTNTLFYGDNLDVLRIHIQDETIEDLLGGDEVKMPQVTGIFKHVGKVKKDTHAPQLGFEEMGKTTII